jgi:hypothetical protein
MTLKDFALELAREACKHLRQHGYLMPTAVFGDLKDLSRRVMFILDFSSEESREATVEMARIMARKAPAAVAYVTETWISFKPKPGVRPSEDPDRKEALVVAAFAPSEQVVVLAPFSRDESGSPRPEEPSVVPLPAESWMDPWPERRSLN